jgi:hypothetical protein
MSMARNRDLSAASTTSVFGSRCRTPGQVHEAVAARELAGVLDVHEETTPVGHQALIDCERDGESVWMRDAVDARALGA